MISVSENLLLELNWFFPTFKRFALKTTKDLHCLVIVCTEKCNLWELICMSTAWIQTTWILNRNGYGKSIEILDLLLLYCDLLVMRNTCLHSIHDLQEKFHLNLEWKRNIQLKFIAWDVHTHMADKIRSINPNSPS